jgi:hypothetical protein
MNKATGAVTTAYRIFLTTGDWLLVTAEGA